MPLSTAQGFRQLEKMDRRPIPRADRASLYLTAPAHAPVVCRDRGPALPAGALGAARPPRPGPRRRSGRWRRRRTCSSRAPTRPIRCSRPRPWPWRPGASRWSAPERPFRAGPGLAVLSGMVMAFGMFFTLAFLPVGLIVALVIVLAPAVSPFRKAGLILAAGAGFLALTAVGWGVDRGQSGRSSGAGTCSITRGSTSNIHGPISPGWRSTRSSWRSRSGCRRRSGARSASRARDPSPGPPGSHWPSSAS